MNQYKITAVLPITYNVEAESINDAETVALEEFDTYYEVSSISPVIHDIEMIVEDWERIPDKVFKTEIMSGISSRIYNIGVYGERRDYNESIMDVHIANIVFMQNLEDNQVDIYLKHLNGDLDVHDTYTTSWNLESLRADDLIKSEFVERLVIDLELVVPEEMKYLFKDWTYEQII